MLLVIAVNSAIALSACATAPKKPVSSPTAAAVAGSLLGGRLTSRVEPRHLTCAFAFLLVAVALYTAARSIPTLL